MWHAWGRGEAFTRFWLRGPMGRDHWEDLGVGDGYIKTDLREIVIGGVTGFSWFRIESSGGIL
jgi:hypothetical protein